MNIQSISTHTMQSAHCSLAGGLEEWSTRIIPFSCSKGRTNVAVHLMCTGHRTKHPKNTGII
jgi:hypothetical protein